MSGHTQDVKMSKVEKSERAQKNWILLKDHINEMKKTDNYLIHYLDEQQEEK